VSDDGEYRYTPAEVPGPALSTSGCSRSGCPHSARPRNGASIRAKWARRSAASACLLGGGRSPAWATRRRQAVRRGRPRAGQRSRGYGRSWLAAAQVAQTLTMLAPSESGPPGGRHRQTDRFDRGQPGYRARVALARSGPAARTCLGEACPMSPSARRTVGSRCTTKITAAASLWCSFTATR